MLLGSDMLPLLLHQSSTTEPNPKTKIAVKIMEWYTLWVILLATVLPFLSFCYADLRRAMRRMHSGSTLASLPGLLWPSLSWLSTVFAIELLMVGWCGSGVKVDRWTCTDCPLPAPLSRGPCVCGGYIGPKGDSLESCQTLTQIDPHRGSILGRIGIGK